MSSRISALQLYKNLLRYGKSLQFTDKEYFAHRIREAYEKNRTLDDPAAISRCLKERHYLNVNAFYEPRTASEQRTMNPLTNTRKINELNEREARLGVSDSNSWHQQYKDSAWIFVGGLPFELSEGDVICIFSQYGEPVNINLVRDQKSGKSKGFCFICYEDQRSTVLAVDNFNGTKICGRTIRVDHVLNYKAPKEGSADEIQRMLADVGCGPSVADAVARKAAELPPSAGKKDQGKPRRSRSPSPSRQKSRRDDGDERRRSPPRRDSSRDHSGRARR